MQTSFLLNSKKHLTLIIVSLFILAAVPLSPKAQAATIKAGGGRTCDTSVAPSPYTNGAPVVRAFYPADGSTVTVTSTGAVIKQSPCQTPYREGWINPANICKLNSFSDVGTYINQSDSNPDPNATAVYNCNTTTTNVTPPAPIVRPTTPPVTTPAVVVNTTATSTPTTNTAAATVAAPVVQAASTSTATSLPNTGNSTTGLIALGGIPTLLGTIGHFFYRRRAFN